MLRCLKEFRIRGVKTNIQFLENVLQNPHFIKGDYTTDFVDNTPELFVFQKTLDRGNKLLNYIADITVNGYSNVGVQPKPDFAPLNMPKPYNGILALVLSTFSIPADLKVLLNGYWHSRRFCSQTPPSVMRISPSSPPVCVLPICCALCVTPPASCPDFSPLNAGAALPST